MTRSIKEMSLAERKIFSDSVADEVESCLNDSDGFILLLTGGEDASPTTLRAIGLTTTQIIETLEKHLKKAQLKQLEKN